MTHIAIQESLKRFAGDLDGEGERRQYLKGNSMQFHSSAVAASKSRPSAMAAWGSTAATARRCLAPTAIAMIRAAFERGVTFFDTAEAYGPFTNEELLGEAVEPFRDQVVDRDQVRLRHQAATDRAAASTAGPTISARWSTPASGGCRSTASTCSISTASTRRCRSRSRRYGQGADREGKVKHFGLSEAGAQTIRRAHAVQPVTAVQSEYSLWTRDVENNGVLAACEELGIGFVPFSPLGAGFLTGKIDANSEFDPERFPQPSRRASRRKRASNRRWSSWSRTSPTRKQATPAQVALAWLLAQKPGSCRSPGPPSCTASRRTSARRMSS